MSRERPNFLARRVGAGALATGLFLGATDFATHGAVHRGIARGINTLWSRENPTYKKPFINTVFKVELSPHAFAEQNLVPGQVAEIPIRVDPNQKAAKIPFPQFLQALKDAGIDRTKPFEAVLSSGEKYPGLDYVSSPEERQDTQQVIEGWTLVIEKINDPQLPANWREILNHYWAYASANGIAGVWCKIILPRPIMIEGQEYKEVWVSLHHTVAIRPTHKVYDAETNSIQNTRVLRDSSGRRIRTPLSRAFKGISTK